jgi:hypothetical protein
MRIRLRGINSITKRLADGTKRTYWYAWKGGPPLRGEPGTAEFTASYNEACARKVVPANGTLLSLLNEYQASKDFTGLADSTRRSYIALIKRIEQKFATFPLSAMTDRRTRGIFKQWRDKIATDSGLRQADYAWTVLARVLSWGFDLRKIDANPCERGGRLYDGDRSENVWSAADEGAFLERAPAHLHLPLMLALWTGQSQGDSCGCLGRPMTERACISGVVARPEPAFRRSGPGRRSRPCSTPRRARVQLFWSIARASRGHRTGSGRPGARPARWPACSISPSTT